MPAVKSDRVRDRVNQLKQELILDTAVDLFYELGYRGTTMDLIAKELGVTKPFLYYRYKSKADILSEVFAKAELVALADLDKQLQKTDPPPVKLQRIIETFIDLALASQKLMTVFFTEERNLPEKKLTHARKIRQDWEAGVQALLKKGKSRGEFHFDDASITLHAIMGSVIWSYNWYSPHDDSAKQETAAELLRCALATVGCTPT